MSKSSLRSYPCQDLTVSCGHPDRQQEDQTALSPSTLWRETCQWSHIPICLTHTTGEHTSWLSPVSPWTPRNWDFSFRINLPGPISIGHHHRPLKRPHTNLSLQCHMDETVLKFLSKTHLVFSSPREYHPAGHSILDPDYIPQSVYHLLARASRTWHPPPKVSKRTNSQ